MKRTIRLTESDLHRIISESVNRVLSEGERHAWELRDDGVDEFDLQSGFPTLDTNGRYIAKGTTDYMHPKIELARQLGSGTGSGYEFRQRHYRNKFAEDNPTFRDARSFASKGKFYNPYGYEDAEQDMKDFNDAERRRQSAADKRWQKAADTRPLHRKGSLNRD